MLKRSPSPREIAHMSDREIAKLDIDVLDRAAFGVTAGDVIEIPLNEVNVKFTGDLEGAIEDVKQWPARWKPFIKLPVEFVYQDGRINLNDGHHRYVMRKKLGLKTITGIVEMINDSPVRALHKKFGIK